MKKMNQKHRGEVCGYPEETYRSDKKSNRGENYWAHKRGEDKVEIGHGSIELLEKKLREL